MQNNSRSLVDRHPDVYREFFKRSEFVASAPGVFFWAGEHAVLSGALAICQQVPLRVYVGLEYVNHHRGFDVLVAPKPEHQMYEYQTDRFRPVGWLPGRGGEGAAITSGGLSDDLKGVLTRLADHLGLTGTFIFRSLHELRRESGSDWSGALSSAFTGAMFAAAGALQHQHAWSTDWFHDQVLAECNSWAWELERIFHGGFASGYGTLCSMAPWPYPQLYSISWRDQGDLRRDPSQAIAREERLADRLDAKSLPISEGTPWGEHGPPCDYGLIYTGKTKDTATAIHWVSVELPRILGSGFDLVCERWPTTAGRPFDFQSGPLNAWQEELNRPVEGAVLQRTLLEGLGVAGIRVAAALFSLSGVEKAGTFDLAALASSVEGVGGGITEVGLNWHEADLVRAALLRAMWSEREKVGVKPTGGSKGGHVLFVCPELEWEDGEPVPGSASERLLKELEAKPSPDSDLRFSLDWCRHRDGVTDLNERGLLVEVTRKGRNPRFLSTCPYTPSSDVRTPHPQATRVFVCYRHDDAPQHAGRLNDALCTHFGDDHVFRDIDTLRGSDNWDEAIEETLPQCHILLVVIGKRWTTLRDSAGRRRLDSDNDVLRREIERALALNIRIMPVLVNGARMPSEDVLPNSIKPMCARQAHVLSDQRWRQDVKDLVSICEAGRAD
jgi:hypothetical protein